MSTSRSTGVSRFAHLAFIPSTYGALSWGIWLLLYQLRLLKWEKGSVLALFLFVLVEVLLVVATLVFSPYYRTWVQGHVGRGSLDPAPGGRAGLGTRAFILSLHAIGAIGLAKYTLDVSQGLGGLRAFGIALLTNSYTIRWESVTARSIGTQISYFGWLAVALTILEVARRRLPRWWLVIAAVQFVGNCAFIDRTRPTWIIMTCLSMLLVLQTRLRLRQVLQRALLVISLMLALFMMIGQWVGKVAREGVYGETILPLPLQSVYLYGTGGFAYFNRIVETNEEGDGTPQRLLYPIYKSLAAFHLVEEPPSKVNAFMMLPFPTNTGTFLEPFYRDGGLFYTLLGILLHSFGLNILALFLLRSQKPVALYAWANLCFLLFIGFFTPKIIAPPIWLFCTAGILSALRRVGRRTLVEAPFVVPRRAGPDVGSPLRRAL